MLPLLIHGDAAFAGQGVVAECFGLSGLKGHRTGGSMHFIVNNQIGFTTAPRFSRSSPYPSDVALMIEAPIFHVNGDDPEAVVHRAQDRDRIPPAVPQAGRHRHVLLPPLRPQRRRRAGLHPAADVSDDQAQHPTVARSTRKRLVGEGVVTDGDVDELQRGFRAKLDGEFEAGESYQPNKADWLDGRWSGIRPRRGRRRARGETGVALRTLQAIGDEASPAFPHGFNVAQDDRAAARNRRDDDRDGQGIDWATAEALAFGTLLDEGFPVRLSGQDIERGTFSQRHCRADRPGDREALHAAQSHRRGPGARSRSSIRCSRKRRCWASNTATRSPSRMRWCCGRPSSATSPMAPRWSSTSSSPSGERKWLRMSGLVLLLPHGYEGQGPEHSSARLERFLQLCAEDNMQVANCTTPANYFHVLRRQMHRKFRKPLILMTPKSLLRHKRVVSDLDDIGPENSLPPRAVGRRRRRA